MSRILKIGDKLRCVGSGEWHNVETKNKTDGPDNLEVLTVRKIGIEFIANEWLPVVWFEEYPGDDSETAFEIYDFDLVEE